MAPLSQTVNPDPRRLLVIDDNQSIHDDFRKALGAALLGEADSDADQAAAAFLGAPVATRTQHPRYTLDSALQGQDGLAKVEAALREGKPYSMAFVDMRMPPGWDGLHTIQRLWDVDPDLQVVICSAFSDHSWDEISEKLGLTDRLLVLKKPFDPVEVCQLAVALSEKWVLRKQASLKFEELERLVQQRTGALTHAALHDRLTGLPNRALLKDRITQAIERKRRTPSCNFAVLFLDFDRFKIINDSLGHEAGDQLLVEIARRMHDALRGTDSICRADDESIAGRLGGDEFVVMIDDVKSAADAESVAARLLQRLGKTFNLAGYNITSTASIGVTTSELDYQNADDMIRDADTAMYHAKAAGKARCVLFDRAMHEEVTARLNLETELRAAVEHRDFILQYQPIVSLATRKMKGFEALIRWKHETSGVIEPGRFISCAEETGLIVPIGRWVVREACRQLKQWRSAIPRASDLMISVNISAQELALPDFASEIEKAVHEFELPPDSLILELTESTVISDPDRCSALLERIRKLGIRIYMDDFGTGYCSLSILHRIPIDGLKIDRSFIRNVSERRDYAAVVQAIVALARNLNITLVAEGIETSEQVALLQSMDCEYAQGYIFGRPQNAEIAEKLLMSDMPLSLAA